jgi:hypothetical protein
MSVAERLAVACLGCCRSSLAAGMFRGATTKKLAHLEIKDAHQQKQADRVGDDDDGIAPQQPIADPQRDTGCQNKEHLEGEIAGVTGLPAFLELREIGNCRAKRGDPADHRSRVHGWQRPAFLRVPANLSAQAVPVPAGVCIPAWWNEQSCGAVCF